MSPIILIGLGAVLFGLGVGLGLWLAHSQRMREAAKASDIQHELDEYRRQVSEHFSQTAQHFQTLGQQYQSLYEHMADGAQSLCDSAQSDALLGFAAGNAPAIAASTADDLSDALEAVTDDVPIGDGKLAEVTPKSETESSESSPGITVSDESPDQAAEESIADQATPEVSIEPERTVH